MIKINSFNENIDIFYKDKKIGTCKTYISFCDIRKQIAEEYASVCDLRKNGNELSDYSFIYDGEKVLFKKNGKYEIKNSNFLDNVYLETIASIIKVEYGKKYN